MKKWVGLIAIIFVVILLPVLFFQNNNKIDEYKVSSPTPQVQSVASQEAKKAVNTPSPMTIDKTKKYQAIIKTSEGDMTFSLNATQTPITVNNFVELSRKKFYDNTIFHRVIRNFMIQGGDPKGDGTGGPGYQFDDEPFEGKYTRGTLAMANAGPDTNGSQFFIMHNDYDLPPNYVIFGKLISGEQVLDKIAQAPTTVFRGENSKPVTPVKVLSIEIKEN